MAAAGVALLLSPPNDSRLQSLPLTPLSTASRFLAPFITSSNPPFHLRCRTPRNPPRVSWRCRSASAGPPPEPSSREDPDNLASLLEISSKIQDRVRIFFAVLFWLSLFFWGSSWDGRDSVGKSKGPRFRK